MKIKTIYGALPEWFLSTTSFHAPRYGHTTLSGSGSGESDCYGLSDDTYGDGYSREDPADVKKLDPLIALAWNVLE